MDDLNKSLETSIFSEDAKDLAVDYSELALDKILDNAVLNEIPIIKTILGLYKTGVGIKERFTLKKVAKFLFRLNNISEKEKAEFINKLSLNDSYKNEIIEKLLILLDRLDDIDKAEIIGNFFKAAIQDKIDVDTFYKFSSIVDRVYIKDLKSFCFFEDNTLSEEIRTEAILVYTNSVKKSLCPFGIMEEKIKSSDFAIQYGQNHLDYSFEYRITNLGREFVEYAKPKTENFF